MKNTITSLLLILFLSNLACAESEPEAIKTKDLMDKLDRSEISTDNSNPTLDNIMPDFEMPKIEFNEKINKRDKSKNKKVKKSKTTVKTVDKESKPQKSKSQKPKNNVVFAKRPISLVQLLKNDKIVLSNSQTYVYRLINNTITQYKLKDKLPLKSLGLKPNSKNSFYVVDISLLKKDAKSLKKSIHKSKTKATKKHNSKSDKTKTGKKSKTKSVKSNSSKVKVDKSVSPEVAVKRRALEKKVNKGKKIKSTINLRALQTNDEIIISGGVQLVLRKKKSTSGVKKYWLSEKLDIKNSSVVEKSKNVYKLIKPYK